MAQRQHVSGPQRAALVAAHCAARESGLGAKVVGHVKAASHSDVCAGTACA